MITQLMFHKVTVLYEVIFFKNVYLLSDKKFPFEGLEVTTRVRLRLESFTFYTSFFCVSFDSCLMSTPGVRNQLSKVAQKKVGIKSTIF